MYKKERERDRYRYRYYEVNNRQAWDTGTQLMLTRTMPNGCYHLSGRHGRVCEISIVVLVIITIIIIIMIMIISSSSNNSSSSSSSIASSCRLGADGPQLTEHHLHPLLLRDDLDDYNYCVYTRIYIYIYIYSYIYV